jgi:hypothetical protein
MTNGKFGSFATTMGRSKIIDGLGPTFAKLPKDVQDHLRNASEIDMNKLAPHAHLLTKEQRAEMDKNGLHFKDATPDREEQVTISKPSMRATDMSSSNRIAALGPGGIDKTGSFDGNIARGSANRVVEEQGRVAATRKGQIMGDLKKQLNYAADKTGVFAEVFSGGQRMHGAEGAVGSHRHDHGGAADIKLYELINGKKRYLDASNDADKTRMAQFVSHSVAAGATGVGHGAGYMGNSSLHIGGGSETSWGGSDWIEGARRQGVAQRPNVQSIDVAARLSDTERAAMTQAAAKNPNWTTTVSPTTPKSADATPAPAADAPQMLPAITVDAPTTTGIRTRAGNSRALSPEMETPSAGVTSRAGSSKPAETPPATPVQPAIAAVPYTPPQPELKIPNSGVGNDTAWKPQEKQIAKDQSVFEKGAEPVKHLEGGSTGRGRRGEGGGLRTPVNNPEQMNPTPGNNGYGEQSSPDGVGLCSV